MLQAIFAYAPLSDVLIVDYHAPDWTGELADELQTKDVRVHVLHRAGKPGLGTAYLAGFKFALAHGYDAAFEMDADFSHDPRYLPDFLRAIEDADVVIGSRYIVGGNTPNWSALRRLISLIITHIFRGRRNSSQSQERRAPIYRAPRGGEGGEIQADSCVCPSTPRGAAINRAQSPSTHSLRKASIPHAPHPRAPSTAP